MTGDPVRIIPHSPVGIPDTGSFEVRTPTGSTYFYWDDNPGRRSTTGGVDQETAKKQAQEFARIVSKAHSPRFNYGVGFSKLPDG